MSERALKPLRDHGPSKLLSQGHVLGDQPLALEAEKRPSRRTIRGTCTGWRPAPRYEADRDGQRYFASQLVSSDGLGLSHGNDTGKNRQDHSRATRPLHNEARVHYQRTGRARLRVIMSTANKMGGLATIAGTVVLMTILSSNAAHFSGSADAAQVETGRSRTVGLATSTSRVDCGGLTAGNCSTVARWPSRRRVSSTTWPSGNSSAS
jgi:hypothetical protein